MFSLHQNLDFARRGHLRSSRVVKKEAIILQRQCAHRSHCNSSKSHPWNWLIAAARKSNRPQHVSPLKWQPLHTNAQTWLPIRRATFQKASCSVQNGTMSSSYVDFLRQCQLGELEISWVLSVFPGVKYLSNTQLESVERFFTSLGFNTRSFRSLLTKSPQVLGCSVEDQLRPVAKWLKQHAFQGDAINEYTILRQKPWILFCDVTNLQQTRESLRSKGLTDTQASNFILQCPEVSNNSLDDLLEFIDWLAGYGIAITEMDEVAGWLLRKVKKDHRQLQPTVDVLLEYGLERSHVAQLLRDLPELVGMHQTALVSRLTDVRQKFGGSQSDLQHMLNSCPHVLLSYSESSALLADSKGELHPVLDWHVKNGVNRYDALALCLKHPQVLQYSTTQMTAVADWFSSLATTPAHLFQMADKWPFIYGSDIQLKVIPVTNWLLQQGVPKNQLARAFTGYPQMFNFDVASLRSKVDYLLGLGMPQAKVAPLLVEHPTFLGTSFIVKSRVMELKGMIGLDSADIARLVTTFPEGLFCNVQQALESYQTLCLSEDQVRRMVSKEPRILSVNFKEREQQQKLEYYLNDVGYSIEDIVDFPWLVLPGLPSIQGRVCDLQSTRGCTPFPQELVMWLTGKMD